MKKVICFGLMIVIILVGMMVVLPSNDPIGDVVVVIQEKMNPTPIPTLTAEQIQNRNEEILQQLLWIP